MKLMMNLDEILDEIEKVSKEHLEDDYKEYIINNLYTLYNKRKEMMGITENTNTFIIDETPLITDTDFNKVKELVNSYKKNKYLTIEEAKYILNWTIQNTRKFISELGISIKGNSLDGYCELAQFLTLYPLEEMGFKVTKNTAQNDFDYNLNHAFGTLTLNVKENDEIKEEHFLIDATYRQFFTKEKCNKGMYYMDKTPDPGYFVKNKVFAKELIKNGFIKLNEEVAKEYGEPFYLSSLELGEKPNKKINYYDNIINSNEDYKYNSSELEDGDISKLFK